MAFTIGLGTFSRHCLPSSWPARLFCFMHTSRNSRLHETGHAGRLIATARQLYTRGQSYSKKKFSASSHWCEAEPRSAKCKSATGFRSAESETECMGRGRVPIDSDACWDVEVSLRQASPHPLRRIASRFSGRRTFNARCSAGVDPWCNCFGSRCLCPLFSRSK